MSLYFNQTFKSFQIRKCYSFHLKSFSTQNLKIIEGKATFKGTKQFLTQSQLPFHHHFKISNVFINPIIHGPPKLELNLTQQETDEHFARALLINRSNCLYISDIQNNSLNSWHISHSMLNELLTERTDFHRSELVLIAGLGNIRRISEIVSRIEKACVNTGLQQIDIAIAEVSPLKFRVMLFLLNIEHLKLFHSYSWTDIH